MSRTAKKSSASRKTGIRPAVTGQRVRSRWAGIAAVAIIAAAVAVAMIGVVLLLNGSWHRRDGVLTPELRATPVAANTADFARYAGSDSCRSCHRSQYDRWAQSHHALAERNVQPALDQSAFVLEWKIQTGTRSVDRDKGSGGFLISAKDLSGNAQPHAARRVIGVDPLRQFLVDAPGGRLQAMEAAYDPDHNTWFDVFGNEDRQPGEWGHWTGRGMNWNSMCAACHNTRLRKGYDEAADAYDTQMAEMGVGCEACHGGMKSHVQWQTDHANTPRRTSPDPTLSKLSPDQSMDTCGSCHARGGNITGDFLPGQSFFDHYSLAGVDETETFYPDGQIHEEDYEYSAFLGSRMHAAGVRCADCHDSHSGKTLLEGNALCMRCHVGAYPKAPIIDPAKHTFHDPASAGSKCINCHMPQTKYMQRHGRHDHGFTIPDPLVTRQTGIPNACNRCHQDKDTDWAINSVDKWYGSKMDRPARKRALTMASAKKGDESARPALLALLNDPQATFYWKAAAVRLLGRWAGDPSVLPVLGQLLRAEHPYVRENTVTALGPIAEHQPAVQQALMELLTDPFRDVRVAAVHALGGRIDPDSQPAREYLNCLRVQADQPTGQLQLAMYESARGNADSAIDHLKKSLAWDARSPALRREAAVLYGALGKPQAALAQIDEACRLEPANAEYAFLRGLAAGEADKPGEAMEAMLRAVQLDPGLGRAWYDLALMQQKAGQTEPALSSFGRAELANPGDPEVPYARAVLLWQLNRVAEARAAAQRAVQIAPGYQDAIQLLQRLQ